MAVGMQALDATTPAPASGSGGALKATDFQKGMKNSEQDMENVMRKVKDMEKNKALAEMMQQRATLKLQTAQEALDRKEQEWKACQALHEESRKRLESVRGRRDDLQKVFDTTVKDMGALLGTAKQQSRTAARGEQMTSRNHNSSELAALRGYSTSKAGTSPRQPFLDATGPASARGRPGGSSMPGRGAAALPTVSGAAAS
mmetsp:Transcript_4783/g.14412  ORF Transcript_4783/g.14412 Transcript_4783/m.14412 type:complete len:201 (-) Transcript_4783:125-727(-)